MKNLNKKGFSLLEILVVISIIGIMTGAMVSSLGQSKNQQALKSAASEVVAAIRETQNYALTGKNAGGSCNNYTFTYSGNSYNVSNGSGCGINDSYQLRNNVTFNNSSSITFTAPHGNTAGATIILSNDSHSINICISDTGMIWKTSEGC